MATTYVDNGGAVNGSNKEYTFSFPYLKTEDVKVSLNGLTQATTKYTVSTSPTKITFNATSVDSTVQESDGAPKTGVAVRVYRDTEVDTAKAVYSAGSSVRAGDLNDNQDQVLYALQETQSDTVNTHRITSVAVTRDKIRDDAIDGTKIADDVINSEHYVAGSIDLEHMSANSVDSDQYVDGSIDLIHMSANSVDSDQYVDGSVDLVHLSANSVDSSKIVDGSIVNADVNASAAIAQSKLNIADATTSAAGYMSAADKSKLDGIEASGDVTDTTNVAAAGAVMNSDLDGKGEILVGDGSGDPTALSVGTNDHVLTADSSTATGVAWKAASGGGAAITIQDEGSSLSTAAETINFTGSGVTASGTGTTKTITISGGGGGGAVTTDYQYLELKAHDTPSGDFVAGSADYELVTKGTNTAVSPDQAAAILISVAGVLQQPNTGTSIGSNDGFCIDGSSIHFGANLAAHPDFVIWMKGSGSHVVSDNSVNESKLNVSNAPTNNHILTADSTVTGGLKWAAAASGTPEGTAILSTGESGGTKFLREDGDGTCSWQAAGSGTPEGTAILSTGESGTTKFLRIDGDGTCSWQVPPDTNTTYSVQDGQLSQNNFTDADHTKLDGITASANNYVHPNHSGEVTSTADGATVIADDVVDEANLKVSNAPTDGQVLVARAGNTGGMTWEASPAPSFEIFEHANALSANKTIGTNNNALVAGPFSTGSYTLTIPSGSVFTVV